MFYLAFYSAESPFFPKHGLLLQNPVAAAVEMRLAYKICRRKYCRAAFGKHLPQFIRAEPSEAQRFKHRRNGKIRSVKRFRVVSGGKDLIAAYKQ